MTNEKQNIDMVMAIKLFFVNYFNFSGRALILDLFLEQSFGGFILH